MSTVFKKFSKSDISITPFTAHKQSTFTSGALSIAGGSYYSASFPTIAYKNGANFEWAGTGSTDDIKNHKDDAGFDLYFPTKQTIHSGQTTLLKFDIACEMHDDYLSDVKDLMEDYIKQGQKIAAIKLYRQKNNCSLREAKEYCDSIQKDLRIRGIIR